MEEYIHVVREDGRSAEHVFPVLSAKTCDPFVTVEVAIKKLRTFGGEADSNVNEPSGAASPFVAGCDAYSTNEMPNEDLEDGYWDLLSVGVTPGAVNAVRARKA